MVIKIGKPIFDNNFTHRADPSYIFSRKEPEEILLLDHVLVINMNMLCGSVGFERFVFKEWALGLVFGNK